MSEWRCMIFGDVHATHTPPRARTTKYADHISAKLEWLAAACAKLKVEVAVSTGDLFHRKSPEERDITRLIRDFGRFPGGRILSVPGNHDTTKPGNIEGTAFETLVAAGVVQDLSAARYEHDQENFTGVTITGSPWKPEADMAEESLYQVPTTAFRPQIHITHGMLVPDSRDYPFACTAADTLEVPENCLLVNGHNHNPFEVGSVINVGSICRITRQDGDTPRRFILVIVKDGKLTWRSVPIKVVGADDPSVYKAEVDIEAEDGEDLHRDRRIMEFVDQMEGEIDVLSATPEDLIHRLGNEFDEATVEDALRYISGARDRLLQ